MRVFFLIALVASFVSARIRYNGGSLNELMKSAKSKGLLQGEKELDPMTFLQKTDHFNPQVSTKWPQRYWVDNSFYTFGGPVFLIIGGEGPFSSGYLTNTMFREYAKEYSGLLVGLEHRYYGQSIPTSDLSSLNLLTHDQALADLAYFRSTVVIPGLADQARWIVCGGSYSGALSAWARTRYPNLFFGSIASSAPVQPVIDFSAYLDVVTASLTAGHSAQCANTAAQLLENLVSVMSVPGGAANVTRDFNLCSQLNSDTTSNDFMNFYSDVVGAFQGVVQYNSAEAGLNITSLCEEVLSAPFGYQGLINATLQMNPPTNGCLDISYNDYIAQLQNTSAQAPLAAARSWIFQTCTNFGYFQTTNQASKLWGDIIPTSFYQQICTTLFSTQLSQGQVDWVVDEFGGQNNPSTPGRIIYPNGSFDPWHVLSVLSVPSGSVDEYTPLVKGGSHCQDWHPATPNDPSSLRDVQEFIAATIGKWLAEN